MTGLNVNWEAIGEILVLLFVISLVFETALTPIFNWRVFARFCEGQGVEDPDYRDRGDRVAVELRHRHLQAHHRRLCQGRERRGAEHFPWPADYRAPGRRRQRGDLQPLLEDGPAQPDAACREGRGGAGAGREGARGPGRGAGRPTRATRLMGQMKAYTSRCPEAALRECRLCRVPSQLRHSHVIPRLMYRPMGQLAPGTPIRVDSLEGKPRGRATSRSTCCARGAKTSFALMNASLHVSWQISTRSNYGLMSTEFDGFPVTIQASNSSFCRCFGAVRLPSTQLPG